MDTLVLDHTWAPVTRVSWQRAITLLFMGKIAVVSEYEDREIKSVTFAIKMPSVVRFLRAIRGRKRAVKFSRENILLRDNFKCGYCARKLTREETTYDHVVPRAHGGQTTWENIVAACVSCNQKKGGRTPDQAGMHLRVQPVKPKKLPEMRVTFAWKPGMPIEWRTWLRDVTYWNGELEQ